VGIAFFRRRQPMVGVQIYDKYKIKEKWRNQRERKEIRNFGMVQP
jgi:hypothetical protein